MGKMRPTSSSFYAEMCLEFSQPAFAIKTGRLTNLMFRVDDSEMCRVNNRIQANTSSVGGIWSHFGVFFVLTLSCDKIMQTRYFKNVVETHSIKHQGYMPAQKVIGSDRTFLWKEGWTWTYLADERRFHYEIRRRYSEATTLLATF